MRAPFILAASVLLAMARVPTCLAEAAPIRVVAAENFYGGLTAELGGAHVRVLSILSNPDQDPHLFEASPSVARALADADIVVESGIGYDPWMRGLLSASSRPDRLVLVAATLSGRHDGDNPHVWYDPAVMQRLATALSAALVARDPADRVELSARLERTLTGIDALTQRIARLRQGDAGMAVTATEPVFGEMARLLGMTMRNQAFQLAVMNDTEPSASSVAAMETDLRRHLVRLLITNSQATDSSAQRLATLARASGVPVVSVSETEPAGQDYVGWMGGQLDRVQQALR